MHPNLWESNAISSTLSPSTSSSNINTRQVKENYLLEGLAIDLDQELDIIARL
jgi:hypothetical protein